LANDLVSPKFFESANQACYPSQLQLQLQLQLQPQVQP